MQLALGVDALLDLVADVGGGDLLHFLANLVELALADHLVDAASELVRHRARLGGPFPGRAQHLWQVFRADHHERHEGDHQQFGPGKIEH